MSKRRPQLISLKHPLYFFKSVTLLFAIFIVACEDLNKEQNFMQQPACGFGDVVGETKE